MEKVMYVIGLTGGVGSGKSLAAQMLAEEKNAELLITDELGHTVMEKGTPCYDEIRKHFGEDIVDQEGNIDRTTLAQRVFCDEAERTWLNRLIHPTVIRYIESYIAGRRKRDGIIVLESALLFESGCDRFCDEIWYVSVSEAIRRKRLEESRGYSQEKITSILKRQMTCEEFQKRSDVVICNNGTQEELRAQILSKIKTQQPGISTGFQ